MKHTARTLPLLLSVFIALVIYSGCRENTLINSKISPANNSINVYDTFLSCITHTFYSDSTLTSTDIGGIPVFTGIGTYNDPFFGTMVGEAYFNLVPGQFDTVVDSLVDSVILVIPYGSFTYGDTFTQTLTQAYQVFYMTDTMSINSDYYSYSSKPIDVNNPLSDPVSVNVQGIRDSFDINTIPSNYPGLRIHLKQSRILNLLNRAMNFTDTSSNPYQEFLNTFNGICVRPANTQLFNSVMPYFELDGTTPFSEAGILVYTHYPGGNALAGVDTDSYASFYFSTGYCAHFNSITKSYSRSPVSSLLHSTQPNDQVIALQNAPGANLDVIIPGISKLPAGIINKAELQLFLLPGSQYGNTQYIQGSTDTVLLAPEKLYPVGVGNGTYPAGITAGLTYILADRYPIYSNTPYIILDGTLHQGQPIRDNNTSLNVFLIDIPREVMASIAAKNDTIHLQIQGTQDYYGAFHMVAGGGAYPDTLYRPRLFVVYSKLTK